MALHPARAGALNNTSSYSATPVQYYINPPPPTNATATPHFINITLDGVRAVGAKKGAFFDGLPESIIMGITLRDIDLGSAREASCLYTQGICEGVVAPACPSCLTQPGAR